MFTKDSGKTVTPEATWEVQMYAVHRNPLLCLPTWLALWFIAKHEMWQARLPLGCED